MSALTTQRYHHGNLRQALIEAAVDMLEQGEDFSLRAVARRAGVSQTAPYRHFPDRASLESAVAAEGFRMLGEALSVARNPVATPADLADFAVVYVRFAVGRPRMFRLMFARECDDSDDQRVAAADFLHRTLAHNVRTVYPDGPVDDLATGLWSTAHGLAFLHLDGKFPAEPAEEMYARVRTAFGAILGIHT